MNRRDSDIVSKSDWRYKREHALEKAKNALNYMRDLWSTITTTELY